MTRPPTNPRRTSGYPILVRSAATTKSHADIIPAPPATAAPCTAATVTTTTVTVRMSRNLTAYANTVRNLGWKVFVCNDLELSLTEAVLAYRDEYIIELCT